ncbi:MAG: putative holin [Desulfovibrionaceae bacterium]
MGRDRWNEDRTWWERRRLDLLMAAGLALVAVVALAAPEQGPVLAFKGGLLLFGGLSGYWLDRLLFPYSQPDGYLERDWRTDGGDGADGEPDYPVCEGYLWVAALAQLRQVALVVGGALAVAVGL